jgi:thioredoxin-related protein
MDMKQFLIVTLVILFSQVASVQARTEEALAAGMVNPGYEEQPAWFKHSFLDLGEDVAEAAEAGRRVILYFYQDGCPYCAKLLQDNFGQQTITEKTQKYFDVITVNMWGDREVTDVKGEVMTEKNFAVSMKVMFTPTLLFLDEQGDVILRINGYYAPHKFDLALDYAAGRHEKQGTFRAYLSKKDPAPASGKLHVQPEYLRPPYQLNTIVQMGEKPLMVLFEQKQCAACDELHEDILMRPESRALSDQFQVVLFDTWSDTPVITPDGQREKVRDWAKRLNIQYTPSMVFFDKQGQEVFRAEGYIKTFHVQSVMEYVLSGAYQNEPEFQRFVEARADALREQGIEVDLMK